MKDRNELIYRIRQIIGDEKEDGFYTPVKYNDEIINVPNFLFKDGPAKYPEIRISPFLTNRLKAHPIRITTNTGHVKRKFYDAIFQIDIYATNENEHIYRHIDEAKIKEAEMNQAVELKKLEIIERKRAAAEKTKKGQNAGPGGGQKTGTKNGGKKGSKCEGGDIKGKLYTADDQQPPQA